MDLPLIFQSPFKQLHPTTYIPPKTEPMKCRISHVRFLVSAQISNPTIQRRSANYKPSIWDHDFIQSIRTDYKGEIYTKRAEDLMTDVRRMFDEAMGPLSQLKLIDTVQRLGVGYHFENEIREALDAILCIKDDDVFIEDLCATALRFRLLRQHGYKVSQDVFNSFKDKMEGDFKTSIGKDVEGMLSLYEASFYGFEGEDILEEAQEFTRRQLQVVKGNSDTYLAKQVSHALELPFHWRMPRLESRWFIDAYDTRDDMDPLLLKFAKLDFNMVQNTHQDDIKSLSRWWRSLGLGERLSFARDRLIESFFWSVGAMFEPQYGYNRREITKLAAFITIIDDIYDVYGCLDELQLFTDAVERWDINAMEELPDYMKVCFLAIYNTGNEMAYEVLKDQSCNIIPYIRKTWADLCKAYLQEAKWYYSGYRPTLEEYLNNALISISTPVLLAPAYFSVGQKITKEAMDFLENFRGLIRSSSINFRLTDDMGTSTAELARGDVPKSIQCYMHDASVSEEVAREHIRHIIGETWKKMNKDGVASLPFHQPFINAVLNTVRTSQCMYQYGDGHGVPDRETKDRVRLLLIEPIPLTEG